MIAYCKYLAFVLFILISHASISQLVEPRENIDSIRRKVVNYLKTRDDFANEDPKKLSKRFHIYELIKKEPIEFSSVGVYGVRVMEAPTETFVLVRKDSSCEIFDLRDLGGALAGIIDFMKRENFQKDSIVLYIKAVITAYDGNSYGSKGKM